MPHISPLRCGFLRRHDPSFFGDVSVEDGQATILTEGMGDVADDSGVAVKVEIGIAGALDGLGDEIRRVADGDGLFDLHGVSPFARLLGTHIPKVRCSQVAASPRCQEKKFLERAPEPAMEEESEARRARYASFERRAEGRSYSTGAVAE